jgi:hypothetical protein
MNAARPLSRRQVLQTASLLGVSALALSASDETAEAAKSTVAGRFWGSESIRG